MTKCGRRADPHVPEAFTPDVAAARQPIEQWLAPTRRFSLAYQHVAGRTSIFERRAHTLESLIRRSIEIKSQFVEGDLREAGPRAREPQGGEVAACVPPGCPGAANKGRCGP